MFDPSPCICAATKESENVHCAAGEQVSSASKPFLRRLQWKAAGYSLAHPCHPWLRPLRPGPASKSGLGWLARCGPSPLGPWRYTVGWSETAAQSHDLKELDSKLSLLKIFEL